MQNYAGYRLRVDDSAIFNGSPMVNVMHGLKLTYLNRLNVDRCALEINVQNISLYTC